MVSAWTVDSCRINLADLTDICRPAVIHTFNQKYKKIGSFCFKKIIGIWYFLSDFRKAQKGSVKWYFPLGLLLQTYCKPTGMSTNPFMPKIICSSHWNLPMRKLSSFEPECFQFTGTSTSCELFLIRRKHTTVHLKMLINSHHGKW